MQHDDGNTRWIAALFHIDAVAGSSLVPVSHRHNINDALIEGVDRRIKVFDCALLA
jgi:hypothetical protein